MSPEYHAADTPANVIPRATRLLKLGYFEAFCRRWSIACRHLEEAERLLRNAGNGDIAERIAAQLQAIRARGAA